MSTHTSSKHRATLFRDLFAFEILFSRLESLFYWTLGNCATEKETHFGQKTACDRKIVQKAMIDNGLQIFLPGVEEAKKRYFRSIFAIRID